MHRFALLAAATLFISCDHHHGVGPEPDEYVGCAADEQWQTFDDNAPTAIVENSSAPLITEPTASSLPAGTKPIFKWSRTPTEVGAPAGDVAQDCPQWNLGQLTTLHLPPISGTIYDLQFTVNGVAEVDHRVLTTLQQWTPTATKWAEWSGKTVTMRMWRMSLLRNDVQEGPFIAAAAYVFSVAP